MHLLIDSRKLITPENTLFIAIKGHNNDGHDYIRQLYAQGLRMFIIEDKNKISDFPLPEANFIYVPNAIKALQNIAAYHRAQFSYPVIAITGSNGKTIVKEWLSEVLSEKYSIVKSPRSYNSQVGVPLSVWQMKPYHQIAIFEAGISKPGEMEKLASILRPTIGIFTNLGDAHDEGFESRMQKAEEKMKLFSHSNALIFCLDHEHVRNAAEKLNIQKFTWSYRQPTATVFIHPRQKWQEQQLLQYTYQRHDYALTLPFTDEAHTENAIHIVCLLLYLGYAHEHIQSALTRLKPVKMRLSMKEGINNCYIIDDSYNNDMAGLITAINFLQQQNQRQKKTIILSDVHETGLPQKQLYTSIAEIMQENAIHHFIGIGPAMLEHKNVFPSNANFFASTDDFLNALRLSDFDNEIILVKGARTFQFEKIVTALQRLTHHTVFEINLDAITHNLNYHRSKLPAHVKIMVMVKAFAYGNGSFEVAHLLQYLGVDYLAVAYADEGVALRKNGIHIPIMVMNPTVDDFQALILHNLEPEIYCFEQLQQWIQFLKSSHQQSFIHIKTDTGMHRLGFDNHELDQLCMILQNHTDLIKVKSVFTHLAAADEPIHDSFTAEQIHLFHTMAIRIEECIGYPVLKHALNSSGILRHSQYAFDMVRLGIGLYGIASTKEEQKMLKTVGTLKTTVSQVKHLKSGDTVGYSRKGLLTHNATIATIAIGYADGYDRRFSNGKGYVYIKNKKCFVIGNVCMDMCMVDVTGIEVKPGDEVIVYGPQVPIQEMAEIIGTIPYELLTKISERVKRIFYTE